MYVSVSLPEMVGGFDDVVYINRFIRHSDRVGFKDIACLVVCQPAAFYVVGVISEIDLYAMVYPPLHLPVFLLA